MNRHSEPKCVAVWYADVGTNDAVIWCDASDIAYGALIEVNGSVLEDRAWLRKVDDKKHINVAELEAVIRGLQLATDWSARNVTLKTDSKTVYGWLQAVLKNTNRIKASGLYSVLVQRRLDIIEDLVSVANIEVCVEWVPSQKNLADALTRVPQQWIAIGKKLSTACEEEEKDVSAALPSLTVRYVSLQEIASEQEEDKSISTAIREVQSNCAVSVPELKRIGKQLCVTDGVLYRSFVDSVNGPTVVPVVPKSLYSAVLLAGHVNTGHSNWETMWRSLRLKCYVPDLAQLCQQFVKLCSVCLAANPSPSHTVPKVRNDVPSRPWEVVQVDTLELGPSQSSKYHCVLVCVDMFTRWAEVIPLQRHDGSSVAAAFIDICTRWGPPRIIRCDNGTEFVNSIVSAVLKVFDVDVRHGAVRHPQSQGGAERFNRSLLTMIRKTIESSADWVTELPILLYYYRTRIHSVLKMSPMMAMMSWEPRDLCVEAAPVEGSLMSWSASLAEKCARIRDYVSGVLSEVDTVSDNENCPFHVGDSVMMRRPSRHQKCLPEFERGWWVAKIIGPVTVVIQRDLSGRMQEKVVNIEHLKSDVSREHSVPAMHAVADDTDDASDGETYIRVPLSPVQDSCDVPEAPDVADVPTRQLRDRASLRAPSRFIE